MHLLHESDNMVKHGALDLNTESPAEELFRGTPQMFWICLCTICASFYRIVLATFRAKRDLCMNAYIQLGQQASLPRSLFFGLLLLGRIQ